MEAEEKARWNCPECQFNTQPDDTGLKTDNAYKRSGRFTASVNTAICMRIILSQGKVNIFNLAKNAGTSVNQIERFYACNLPISAELVKNLQSFGED